MSPEVCIQSGIFQWIQNKTSVLVLFLSYFPLYFHTLKPCISPVQNSMPYTVERNKKSGTDYEIMKQGDAKMHGDQCTDA